MTIDDCWDPLLEEALSALLSMRPDRIESVDCKFSEQLTDAGQVDQAMLAKLKRTRAAALKAAELWRGCLPQEGYTALGPAQSAPAAAVLCITG